MNLFRSQWFPKQFTQDDLAKYMIGGHAMKVKVFHPHYNEHREVVMKTMKDRAAITRGWPRVVRTLRMEEGTIWAFRFTFSSTRMYFAYLFIVLSTTMVHHSLLGASVVLQYMYLCIELFIRG